MKILFIYAPFTYPISPPAGIAYLKGFMEDNFREIETKCMDLNLDWYKNQFKLDEENLIRQQKISKKEYVKLINNFFSLEEREKKYSKLFYEYLKTGEKDKELKLFLEKDIEKINKFRPDIIGFSVSFKSQLLYSLVLSKVLKEKNKKLFIIFGGGLFLPNSLSEANKLVRPKNPVDIIVRGNGEIPLFKMLENYKNNSLNNLSKISSITYYNSFSRKVLENGPLKKKAEGKIFDYRSVPDYSDFNLKKYFSPEPVLPIKVAGGCSWGRCTFCQISLNGPGIYPRSSEKLIKEIRYLKKKFGISKFHFIASEIPKSLLNDIADNLMENKIKINYSVYVRPTKLIDNKLLKKLYQSGCRLVDYGVEALTQRILDLMDKGTKVEDILDLLRRTKKAGIKTFCWYIVGFPSQTVGEIKKEINVLEKNFKYIDFFGCHPFYLKESSLVYQDKNLLTSNKLKHPLLLEINKTKIFGDEEVEFKVKKGVSQKQAKYWADIIGGKFINSKKDGQYYQLMKNFREFHILSSI